MKQYIELLEKIIDEGVVKESGRENMPNTISISNSNIKMNLSEGFPLLTTKKMYWGGIVHELLWFLRGETNIKYLVDNNVNIWNGDAYRWYLKYAEENSRNSNPIMKTNEDGTLSMYSLKEFIYNVKNLPDLLLTKDKKYKLGDLGKVYGYQWRNQNGIDQISEVINGLKNNPYSRYHIIDGWNKSDFKEMALPPCHLLYHFIVRPINYTILQKELYDNKNVDLRLSEVEGYIEKNNIPKFYLDLNMYQRSVDTGLGLGFNLASMSLLLEIISKTVNMIPGVANWVGGDTHIYVDHLETLKEQVKRKPLELPKIKILKDLDDLNDICSLTITDIQLINYKSYEKISLNLFTGLK